MGDVLSTNRSDQSRGFGGRAGFQWVWIQQAQGTLAFQFLPVSGIVCCIANVEELLLLSPRWLDPLNGVREDVRAVLVHGQHVPGA